MFRLFKARQGRPPPTPQPQKSPFDEQVDGDKGLSLKHLRSLFVCMCGPIFVLSISDLCPGIR